MMLAPALHYLYLIFPTLYLLFGGPSRFYDLILACIIFIPIHWNLFKHDCVLSYMAKKMKDSSYTVGSNGDSPGLNVNVAIILEYFTALSGLYLTHKLGYNLYLYIIITIMATYQGMILPYVPVLLPIMQMYFLKDNRYFIPGLLTLFVLSVSVHAMDKNMRSKAPQVYPSNVIPSDKKDDNN